MSSYLNLNKKFKMDNLEKEVFDLSCTVNPQAVYSMGLEQFAEEMMILSTEKIQLSLEKVRSARKKCRKDDLIIKKYLDSIETSLLVEEPALGVAQITDTNSTHLIKEGFNTNRLKKVVDLLDRSLEAWIKHLEGKTFTVAVKILAQYQVLGAYEILDVISSKSADHELSENTLRLRKRVDEFRQKFIVPGFTNGDFLEIREIMKDHGADLGREAFYPMALKRGFDYHESARELERRALKWIDEELPKLKSATRKLSLLLHCENHPESVDLELRKRPGVTGKEALHATVKMRPMVQKLVVESIVGMNPKYDARVVETPPYLTPIIPTGAAQGLDNLTETPIQLFYITTDPWRAPPGGFADLVNLLVHEEYGHCLHFSNTAEQYAARASILELLPSLHSGSTSEGLAFQRELEFFDMVQKIADKSQSARTDAEKDFVRLADEYGGFNQFLLELEFVTYRNRMIRFLRVVGDTRINSGKQNLLDFLAWAEKKTGLSQRTVFYQLFPAHEGIFPGYATCYAIVGQEIRAIQRSIKSDSKKMVKFNAYASSMGWPPRSVYVERLKEYARKLNRK